jgi:beta-galactosidase
METPDKKYTSYNERNPVGSYRRTFTIPQDWKEKQIILHLAGASSGTFVWINGSKVGYSQDSRLPAEFDITSFLKPGENNIAIETYKYCDGSYLEDQDYWRMSGIYRDIFIRAVPRTALWDIYGEPIVNLSDKNGSIRIHYTPVNFTSKISDGYNLRVSVFSPNGKEVVKNKVLPLTSISPGMGSEIVLPEINWGKWNYGLTKHHYVMMFI